MIERKLFLSLNPKIKKIKNREINNTQQQRVNSSKEKHLGIKRATNVVLLMNKLKPLFFLLVFDLMIYRTQISNQQIRNRAYSPDTVRYQVTDLILLRYHGHLAEFGKSKYRIMPCL